MEKQTGGLEPLVKNLFLNYFSVPVHTEIDCRKLRGSVGRGRFCLHEWPRSETIEGNRAIVTGIEFR